MAAPMNNKNHFKHGLAHTPIDNVYKSMISRCYCEKNNRYHRYGARGIIVCEEWKSDKSSFFSWAFRNGYQLGLTLDRIDVNGNYEPSNCRWATPKMQANNRCNNRHIVLNGESHTIAEWADIKEINIGTLWSRIKSGWPIEEAINTPIRGKSK